MKRSDILACAAKLELALKTFRTVLASVDAKWTDAARRDFQEMYLDRFEPNVKSMVEAVARLAEVLAAAERQCGDDAEAGV